MILLIHIIVAIASLISAGISYLAPSAFKLKVSYSLVAATLASGFYMVILQPAHMVHMCVSGLIYLAVAFWGISIARHKLTRAYQQTHDRQEKTID